jgi:hypothetical protein
MPELHAALARAQPFEHRSADQLAVAAIELFHRCPPEHLVAAPGVDLGTSVAAAAQLKGGCRRALAAQLGCALLQAVTTATAPWLQSCSPPRAEPRVRSRCAGLAA